MDSWWRRVGRPVSGRTWPRPADVVWWPFLLAGIIALAAVVRLYDIAANPPGFFADEAAYGYNAYTILHSGKDEFGRTLPLFFESFGDYKTPVYIYSLVPFVAALGLTEVAVRLTSAVYGILTVLAVYLLVQELFKQRYLSLTAALLLAVSPWHIHFSRTGFGEVTVHVFFLVVALYLFALGLRRPMVLPAAALSIVLALYSYRAAWVLIPPLLLVLSMLYYRELFRHWRYTAIAVAMVALACIPILLLLLNVDERAQDRSVLTLDLGMWGTLERVIEHYISYFRPSFLLDGSADQNLRHVIPGQGWIYSWQVPFAAFGAAALASKPTRPKLLVLALILLFPLAGAVTVESPASTRALFGSVAFAIITAYGLVTAARLLRSWQPSRRYAFVGAGLAATLLAGVALLGTLQFASFLDTYHGSYQEVASGRNGWQWGGRAIVERFLEVEDEYDRLWIDGGAFNRPDIFIRFYAPDGCPNCHVAHEVRYQPDLRHFYALRSGAPWFKVVEAYAEPRGLLLDPSGETIIVFSEVPVGISDPDVP